MHTIKNPYTEQTIPQAEDLLFNDDTYLVDAIANNLVDKAVNMINDGLKNPRFSVHCCAEDVEEALLEGDYPEMALVHHSLIIPTSKVDYEQLEKVKEVFCVVGFVQFKDNYIFDIQLSEGPYGFAVGDVIYTVNEELGVEVEKLVQMAGLVEYTCIFNISMLY